MKVFTLALGIAAAAIGISGVFAKAVPQEAVELPASILNAALANREAGSEARLPAHRLIPCWHAPADSIHCPVVKRDPDGAVCFSITEGKRCCPDRDCVTGDFVPVKRQDNTDAGSTDGGPVPDSHKFDSIIPVHNGRLGCWGICTKDDWLVNVTCPTTWDWITHDPSGFELPPYVYPVKAPYPSEGCWFKNQDNQTYREHCPEGMLPITDDGKLPPRQDNTDAGSTNGGPVPESHKFNYLIPVATNQKGCWGINQDNWEIRIKCPKDYDWLPKDPIPRFLFEFPTKSPLDDAGKPEKGCWFFTQDNQTYRRQCRKGEKPGEKKRDVEPHNEKWELPIATPHKPGCWYVNQDGDQVQRDCPKDGEWPYRRNDCYHFSGKVVCPQVKRVETWQTLPGTYASCTAWYFVSATDHEKGCLGIAAKYGISQDRILELNKDINAKCTNLKVGYAYCVAASPNDSVSSTSSTLSTSTPSASSLSTSSLSTSPLSTSTPSTSSLSTTSLTTSTLATSTLSTPTLSTSTPTSSIPTTSTLSTNKLPTNTPPTPPSPPSLPPSFPSPTISTTASISPTPSAPSPIISIAAGANPPYPTPATSKPKVNLPLRPTGMPKFLDAA